MNTMKKFAGYLGTAVLAVSFCAMGSTNANAEQLIVNDTISVTVTDWSDSLTIPQFNPALGTLQSVKIVLNGHVEGSAAYESLDNDPALVNLDLVAEIILTRPDASVLVSVLPLANVSENAGAFDGAIDFDGDSGSTFDGLSADEMDMTTLNSPADLLLFTGLGNVLLPISANGQSAATGPGNITQLFSTSAGADVQVTYTYAAVPEPASCVLACAALAGLAVIGRRLRKS